LAENTTVQFESPAAVRLAIERYAAGPADFADCLLSVQAQAVAAAATYTFDRKMKSLPGVVIL
jgi:predicted nucleic-acid-binding protein